MKLLLWLYPGNPMDMILEAFGTNKIAEVSGRDERLVVKDGKTILEKGISKAQTGGNG